MTLADLRMRTLMFLDMRKRSYIFGLPALLRREKPTPDGDMMLADLARFCRAVEPCWGSTAREHARYEGRREVFLRITQHLHLSAEELFSLYAQHRVPTEDDQ